MDRYCRQHNQFILDAYYEDFKIYLMLENGSACVITLESDKRIKSYKYLTPDYFTKITPSLFVGYFLKVAGRLLFINYIFVIEVTDDSATVLTGYHHQENFQSVVALHDGQFFATLGERTGIDIFKVGGRFPGDDQVHIVGVISNGQFAMEIGGLHLCDIAYYPTSEGKYLLVLDEKLGLFYIQIHFQAEIIKNTKATLLYNMSDCTMMALYDQKLYVVCSQQILQLDLKRFTHPRVKDLPNPNINIRQIYQYGALLAVVGRNSFKIYYNYQLVDYYEGQNVEKLIFLQDMFVRVGEKQITIGQYEILDPYIGCLFKEEGLHHLAFRTIAECNQDFLQLAGVSDLAETSKENICEYLIYKDANIYDISVISSSQFAFISIIVLIVSVCIAGFVYGFEWIKVRKIKDELESQLQGIASESEQPQNRFNDEPEMVDGQQHDKAQSRTEDQFGKDNQKEHQPYYNKNN